MKKIKIAATIVLISSLFVIFAAAQTKKKTRPQKAKPESAKKTEDFKILASGAMSNIEEPLVYPARDAATYEHLKKVAPELPPQEQINFKTMAVIAVFLGTKPTAGFDLTIKRTAAGAVKIEAVNPPKGAMTAQIITSPFKIALVPIAEENPLRLEIGADWKKRMRAFRVSSGEFAFSGGFAPVKKKFELTGTIGVMQVGDLAAFEFNLIGKAPENRRKLSDIVSGSLRGNIISLGKIGGGSLIDPPHPALSATGTLDENNLSLIFKSLPTKYADGYAGEGRLSAIK